MTIAPDTSTAQDLIAWRKDVHSQFGEDGILEELLRRLNITHGWFVEFGAWDGKHLSNTRNLYDQGWSGVYIEGDARKYQDLRDEYDAVDRIVPLNVWVGSEGDQRLDALLQDTPVPRQFDVLSIDIDSDDYHVWHALTNYEPTIVVIETNMTFPYNVDFVQKKGSYLGSSALAVTRLAVSKGYTLVCYNEANCIFVRDEMAAQIDIPNRSFAYLFHAGRLGRAGGYFVSEFNGRWHSLHENNVAWGIKKIFTKPTKLAKLAHRFEQWNTPEQIRGLFDPRGLPHEFGV